MTDSTKKILTVRQFAQLGGQVKGKCKRRGNKSYYVMLGKLSGEARKAKKKVENSH